MFSCVQYITLQWVEETAVGRRDTVSTNLSAPQALDFMYKMHVIVRLIIKTFPYPCDHMILYFRDHMVLYSCDHMILYPCDHMVLYPCDHMILYPRDHMVLYPCDHKSC